MINLYHSPYWKTELLGQWIPEGHGFRFKEGLLEEALKKSPQSLLIHNGLESNPEYQAFWHKAQALGSISYQGRTITLPKELKVSHQKGYDWKAFKTNSLTCYRGIGQGEVINPTRFHSLFKRYLCDANQLTERDGLIEEAAKRPEKTLTLTINRELSVSQWAKLLAKSVESQVTLTLYLAEGVNPPPELGASIQDLKSSTPSPNNDRIYPVCSSLDAKKAFQGLNNPLVIDVSEAQASDLIKRLSLKESSELSLSFEETNGALIKALKKNRTVVLKGQISDALMDELQAVFQERQNNPNVSGQLLLMPTTLMVQADLKRFETLSNTPPEHISAHKFIQGRIDACHAVLKELPYVFLSGLSGVGKTTFVEKEFCGPKKHTLHQRMEDWLNAKPSDATGHYHILFIDEANLSPRDFSEFQDLFNIPPTLYYKGKVYPLSPQHKVVFAGNPLSYGEGRKLASLFQEHGGAVVFEPLAYSVIEERILAPVFEGSSWTPKDRQAVQNHLLEVYKTLCGYSETNILISPRELQTMALLTDTYCQKFKADPKEVVQYYAYQLAAPLVPDSYQNEFERFKPKKPLEHAIHPSAPPKKSSFCVTPSRKPLEQTVNQLFLLREQRRLKSKTANDVQLYGGLGGMVLEGPPGVGKSEFLVHLLRSWDFKEVHGLREGDAPEDANYFYRIPANYSIKQKKDLLRQAFHEGAVVIMDEINSSPMMESFLNHLLMGSDDAGLHPKNPGFILLGTQNPATFSGRRRASEALNRRLQTVEVPEYPLQELVQILVTKGVKKDKAQILSEQWQKAYQTAQANQSTLPTFRDLMNMAKEWYRSQGVELAVGVDEEEQEEFSANEDTKSKKDIQKTLKGIQNNFIDQLKILYTQLEKHAAGDVQQVKAVNTLRVGLDHAQEKLFKNIKTNPTQSEIKKHIEAFSLACSAHAKTADAVMGHGWLFRAVEVVAKAIAALFVGIGMTLGSIALQGFAKESHRTWYKDTFFTLHQTEASKDIEAINKATRDLESQLEDPEKTQVKPK